MSIVSGLTSGLAKGLASGLADGRTRPSLQTVENTSSSLQEIVDMLADGAELFDAFLSEVEKQTDNPLILETVGRLHPILEAISMIN